MEWGEGVSSLRVSSMVRTQLREKYQYSILADLNELMRDTFHNED